MATPGVSNENQKMKIKKPVTVVGAGFSGLASAWYLSRAGYQVEVIERAPRVGGLISTTKTSIGFVESAANGFLNSRRLEELFGLLNLDVVGTLPTARKRFIFRRGYPRRWPLGVFGSIRFALFLVLYLVARFVVAPKPKESVRVWTERVMGAEAGQYLVEAALQGIYAGDPNRMSASLILGRFFRRKPWGENAPKVRGTVSSREGMGQVTERLRERLERQGVKFTLEQKFKAPSAVPNHPLVIATSAHAAADILADIDPVRSLSCQAVELLPAISVTIVFREPPRETRGFGCLFPLVEGMRASGVLMNTFIFPGRNPKGFSETWIFAGARESIKEMLEMTDEQIVNIAIEERQGALNASAEHYGFRVTRWPEALPHYTSALEEALPELRGFRRNTILVGNYLGEIGLARILDRASRLPEDIKKSGEWTQS